MDVWLYESDGWYWWWLWVVVGQWDESSDMRSLVAFANAWRSLGTSMSRFQSCAPESPMDERKDWKAWDSDGESSVEGASRDSMADAGV
jgi:hypothetical protein